MTTPNNKQQISDLADWCDTRGDNDTANQIRELYLVCTPRDQIAEAVGVDAETVDRVLRDEQ